MNKSKKSTVSRAGSPALLQGQDGAFNQWVAGTAGHSFQHFQNFPSSEFLEKVPELGGWPNGSWRPSAHPTAGFLLADKGLLCRDRSQKRESRDKMSCKCHTMVTALTVPRQSSMYGTYISIKGKNYMRLTVPLLGVCDLRKKRKVYYILLYSEIGYLLIRIIKDLQKIHQCSGPTLHWSSQNLCGDMG